MLNLFQIFRCYGARRCGSALLIVLGFLSFMIISGVSFSIYMRIERQASSNYRHAVSARHVLNTALARAMEEVDSELRLDNSSFSQNDKNHPKRCELKFPFWWKGINAISSKPTRIRNSAVEDPTYNGRNARVLSIEALSFLPPFLVNDVRRYAAWQPGDDDYEGAKWRTLDGPVNGRYAYLCVNVSDMLDVNKCRALTRDSFTNQVSLGHLFANDVLRQNFDSSAASDRRYFSLQDFYSSRYERSQTDASSPYHSYLDRGNFQPFRNADLPNQMFITDSMVKHEPVKKVNASNFGCNIWSDPPFAPTVVNNPLQNNALFSNLNNKFYEAFLKAVDTTIPDKNNFAATVKDYMDEDCVPSRLNIPTLERVPMVSEIVLDNGLFCPKIVTSTRQVGNPAHNVTVYSVQLFGNETAAATIRAPLYVELIWPFKLGLTRPGLENFDLELECYLRLHPQHNNMTTVDFTSVGACIRLNHTRTAIPRFWAVNDFPSEQQCYYRMDTEVEAPRGDVVLEIVDGDGNFYNGCVDGQEFSVSFIVFARVRTRTGGEYVDCAPHAPPHFPDPNTFPDTPKLYFQTQPCTARAVGMSMVPMLYAWTGLEVADPRFNHNAANWVPNMATPANCQGKNASATTLLTPPLQGRDADLFMFVSDSGTLRSPGELGFIVRPDTFNDPDRPPRDFHTANLEPVDKEYMFRTIRLYDHGGPGANQIRDDLYDYFYAANADGTLPGARVNPLSDLPEVLEAAIWDTPVDYWVASTNNGLTAMQRRNLTFTRNANAFGVTSPSDNTWRNFCDRWIDHIFDVSKVTTPPAEKHEPNTLWSRNLSDYYGDHTRFEWYSEDVARRTIFGIPNVLPNPLHEIDRKMLYSFSLDSFSDRQQLFLYFIRAEVTAPSFGGGSDVGMQSLAGGRAVALVWRDPYPRGFVKAADVGSTGLSDDDNSNDIMKDDKDNSVVTTANTDWYPNNNNYDSPWEQYLTPHHANNVKRFFGHHDTRVLFFKQLGQ